MRSSNNQRKGYWTGPIRPKQLQQETLQSGQLAGMIFCANETTFRECLDRNLFGHPYNQLSNVQQIKPGTPLFLFDYVTRCIYGVFVATSFGTLNLVPEAWAEHSRNNTPGQSPYPAQVKVQLQVKCHPLAEAQYKKYLTYYSKTGNKFQMALKLQETVSLLKLFEPTDQSEWPMLQSIIGSLQQVDEHVQAGPSRIVEQSQGTPVRNSQPAYTQPSPQVSQLQQQLQAATQEIQTLKDQLTQCDSRVASLHGLLDRIQGLERRQAADVSSLNEKDQYLENLLQTTISLLHKLTQGGNRGFETGGGQLVEPQPVPGQYQQHQFGQQTLFGQQTIHG